jgi:hypothetical protein
VYYEKLQDYHSGKLFEWLDFFLGGVISTAQSSIVTCEKITKLRENDMRKLHALGKTSAQSTGKILEMLYSMPIVGIGDIVKCTGFTDRGGYKAIERMVGMGILKPMKEGDNVYGQKWVYADYLTLFTDD